MILCVGACVYVCIYYICVCVCVRARAPLDGLYDGYRCHWTVCMTDTGAVGQSVGVIQMAGTFFLLLA